MENENDIRSNEEEPSEDTLDEANEESPESEHQSSVDSDDDASQDDDPEEIPREDIVYKSIQNNIATNKHYFTATMRNMFVWQNWVYMKPLTSDFLVLHKMPCWYVFNPILVDIYSCDMLVLSELKIFLQEYIGITVSNRFNLILELMMFTLTKPENILLEMKPYLKELSKHVKKSRDFVKKRNNDTLPEALSLLEKIYNIYEQYIEFVDWNMLLDQYRRESQRSVSRTYSQMTFNQDLSDKLSSEILEKMSNILESDNPPELNIDIVPLTLIHIYEHRNELEAARAMFERYAEQYPDHLNSHVYLYEFLRNNPHMFTNEEFKQIRTRTLRNIVRLCPDSRYSLRFASFSCDDSGMSASERIRTIVNFIDYVKNRRSKKAWTLLAKAMRDFTSDNNAEYETTKNEMEYRFIYWKLLHYLNHEIEHFAKTVHSIQQHLNRLESDSETAFSSTSYVNDNVEQNFHRIVIPSTITNFSKEDYLLMRYKLQFLEAYKQHFGTMSQYFEDFLLKAREPI